MRQVLDKVTWRRGQGVGGRRDGGVRTVGVEQPDISSQQSKSAPVDSRQREGQCRRNASGSQQVSIFPMNYVGELNHV